MRDSLCWHCQKSGRSECSWDREFKPVPGWKATPSKMRLVTGVYTDTYQVYSCPEFFPVELGGRTLDQKNGRPPKLTDNQLERWLKAGKTQKEISFLSGATASTVCERVRQLNRKKRGQQHENDST